ncbi:hypothetical protein BC342_11200 [Streptomyces olivaceus]|nr:hypothetical protein BC342_11200 [Streptomyces olivaceus]
MYGQQFARLEDQLLSSLGELEEVAHPECMAAELDDVPALHGGRGDLDVGDQRAAGGVRPHRVTSKDADESTPEWHGQSHASQITGMSAGTGVGEASVQTRCVPTRQAVER